jgi:MFS transporter, DHA1 family, solute carrier family 18 (vesicular acetylcholine transporter), member 3
MIPICVITFAYGVIDAIVLPTMAYLVESRHDSSVYGSVYAIVDISFSLCYAFGPMIAGVILHYAGFMALTIIICATLSGYAPFLVGLRKIYASKDVRENRVD